MKNISTYRTLSVTLATIFFIFNIGLPLIVASCPMVKNPGQAMCSMCPNPSNSAGQQVTTVKNSSCCATVIAADRNTNEFVKSHSTNGDPAKIVVVVIHQINIQSEENLSSAFFVNNSSSSPPLARDIPIFVSSLLI